MAAFPGNAAAFDYRSLRADDSSTADGRDCRSNGPGSLPSSDSMARASTVLRDARRAARARDNHHVRRAIEVMLRSVLWLPNSEEVARLREQGSRLLAEVESWSLEAPAPEVREEAMRRVAAMHVCAVSALRSAREAR